MKEKPDQKLYMKWWFWVVIGFMFIVMVLAMIPYPDEEIEDQLIECQELLYEFSDSWNDYENAMYDYCELDPTNILCEGYQ